MKKGEKISIRKNTLRTLSNLEGSKFEGGLYRYMLPMNRNPDLYRYETQMEIHFEYQEIKLEWVKA